MDVVASSITFFSTVVSAYEAIRNLNQLPREFQEVQHRLPLVKETLYKIQRQLDEEGIDTSTEQEIRRRLQRCDEDGQKLKDIFNDIEAHSKRGESPLVRYKNTLVRKGKQLGKAHRVESLMGDMLKCVKDLAETQIFRLATQTQVAGLASSIDDLAHTMSSVTDADFDQASHFGPLNIASGGTGHQVVQNGDRATYSSGGNNNNFGAGQMITGQIGTLNLDSADVRAEAERLRAETERRRAENELRSKVMKSLAPLSYLEAKNQNKERLEGTCVWFTEHEKFQQWRSATTSSLLYVSADPGCGKSVLSRYLVDSILPLRRDRILCYWFFKEDIELQASAANALRCILHQIFTANTGLLTSDILKSFDNSDQIITSVHSLWDILLKVCKDKSCGEIVCVIDALDECQENGRKTFSECVRSFFRSPPTDSMLKFLITSRPYAHISGTFIPSIYGRVIQLKGENEAEVDKIAKEIDIVIQAEVDEMRDRKRWSEETVNLVRSQLRKVPNRTYLWAHLTLDWLGGETGLRKKDFKSLSTQLPHTVDEAYERILERRHQTLKRRHQKHKRPDDDPDKIMKLLHIMVAATRALTLREMDVALSINSDHKTIEDVDLLEDGIETHIRELCGLFVTIVDKKVYFLHLTAKEFLVQSSTSTPIKYSWGQKFCIEDAHKTMFHICCWVLMALENSPRDSGLDDYDFWKLFRERCAFWEYSFDNFRDHYKMYPGEDLPMLAEMLNIDTGGLYKDPYDEPAWFKVLNIDANNGNEDFCCEDGRGTPLFISICCGWTSITHQLLQSERCIQELKTPNDPKMRSPLLSVAAKSGNADIIRELLSCVDKNRRSELVNDADSENIPLITSAYFHEFNKYDLAKILIEAGADIEAKDHPGWTAMYYAWENKDIKFMWLLLQNGARLDFEDINDFFELLFDHKDISIESLSEKAMCKVFSPHYLDIYYTGHDKADLILRFCDINTVDDCGYTPLTDMLANLSDDSIATVLEFISRGADILAADNHGHKPLWYCDGIRTEPVIRKILDKVPREDFKSADGFLGLLTTKNASQLSSEDCNQIGKVICTLITIACQNDDIGLVMDLYTADFQEFRPDWSWILHLIAALVYRSDDIATFLIHHGDDTDSSFKSIKLATHIALATGHDEAIRVLLPKLKASDEQSYNTYLSTMAFSVLFQKDWIHVMGDYDTNRPIFYDTEQTSNELTKNMPPFEALIDVLQRHGADINAHDDHHRTALFHTKSPNVVRELIEKKANVEAKDDEGLTPLLYSIRSSNLEIANELIRRGADINAYDKHYRTALFHTESPDVVRELIKEGANIEAKDDEGFTPLLHFIRSSKPDIAKVFIQCGADINAYDKHYRTALFHTESPDVVRELIKEGANIEAKDDEGFTPLLHFIRSSKPDIAKVFIQCGADINAYDKHHRTALFHSETPGVIRELIEMGANVDAADIDGFTPLLHFIRSSKPDIAKELILYYGANINAETHFGQTAMMLVVGKDRSFCHFSYLDESHGYIETSWFVSDAKFLWQNKACICGVRLRKGNSKHMILLVRSWRAACARHGVLEVDDNDDDDLESEYEGESKPPQCRVSEV